MVSISRRVAKALEREFIEGAVYRIDLDRIDVAPDGSSGILRSLPVIGDRDSVKPGDTVKVITIAGERLALVGDVADSEIEEEVIEDTTTLDVEERVTSLAAVGAIGGGINPETMENTLAALEDVYIPEVPTSGELLKWDHQEGYWVPGSTALSKLSDVDVITTLPVDNDVLAWDDATGKWVPKVGGAMTNADTLDGFHATDFLRNVTTPAGATIANNGGAIGPDIRSQSNGAAAISFHRPDQYAVNFGLDTNNKLKVGGWSMGNVSYEILHTGNLSTAIAPNSYAVTWSGSGTPPSLGNGSLLGYYYKIGRLVYVTIALTMGSTTGYGNGEWHFTLPFTAAYAFTGSAWALDTGVAYYSGSAFGNANGTTVQMFTTTGSAWRSSYPFPWGSADRLHVTLCYLATT